MNNFKKNGPGGLRDRSEFLGGRPSSDANYGPKKKSGGKPSFGGKGGFKKSGDRSDRGDRGGFGGKKGGDRGGFRGSRDGERREVTMHKATCASCGSSCEVPFRPDGSKPVLCSECFGKNRPEDRPKRDFNAPRPPSPEIVALQAQVASLEVTVNEILSLLKTAQSATEVVAEEKAPKKTVAKKVAKKTVKKVAKKVAKKVSKK